MKNLTRFLLPLVCFIPLQQAAFAQQVLLLSGVAKTWRLENYVPDNVVIWYSGSACATGQLTLPANATKADRDRLFPRSPCLKQQIDRCSSLTLSTLGLVISSVLECLNNNKTRAIAHSDRIYNQAIAHYQYLLSVYNI